MSKWFEIEIVKRKSFAIELSDDEAFDIYGIEGILESILQSTSDHNDFDESTWSECKTPREIRSAQINCDFSISIHERDNF